MSYFIVSWDISAVEPTWSQTDKRMLECIDGLSWTRPVNTFYMVKTDSPLVYQSLLKNLQQVAQSAPVKVRFIMSPLLSRDSYDGWLEPDAWPKVRAIAA